MESIDDYEHRKKERAERLLGSNKKSMQAISRLAQPVKRVCENVGYHYKISVCSFCLS